MERKGPLLGLILGGGLDDGALRAEPSGDVLLSVLVGARIARLDIDADDAALETAATRAVSELASNGASRIVIAFDHAARETERRIKRVLLQKFPQHLLGAVPILYSHEMVEDANDIRRTWTALFNAFLHPAMERFLYHAEHKLREYKIRNPLLIFRNDGYSARVAKTIALKTYSSGPRGGAEGAKALAASYGVGHLLSIDVGGTTTDIAESARRRHPRARSRQDRRGDDVVCTLRRGEPRCRGKLYHPGQWRDSGRPPRASAAHRDRRASGSGARKPP